MWQRPGRGAGAFLRAVIGVLLLAVCWGCGGSALDAQGHLNDPPGPAAVGDTPGATQLGPVDTSNTPLSGAISGFDSREVAYRQFDISLTRASVSRQTKNSFGDPTATSQVSDTTYLYLLATVRNTLNYTSGYLQTDEVSLIPSPGADPVPMEWGNGDADGSIRSGTSATGWMAFELKSQLNPAAAQLRFGKVGYQADLIPLTGPVAAPIWPKPVTVNNPGNVRISADTSLNITINKTILANSVSYDNNGNSVAGEQALTDHRKLFLSLTVELLPGPSNSGYFGRDQLHLKVDGERQAVAPDEFGGTVVQSRIPAHLNLVWDVPVSGKVEIEWGALDVGTVVTGVPVS